MPHIDLHEWEVQGPTKHRMVDSEVRFDARSNALIQALQAGNKLEILQLKSGIEVRSSSWVGQLSIGNLSISVQPKIKGLPLIELLRYAYGLRALETFDTSEHRVSAPSFQGLLVAQLLTEATELLARGLHRDYLKVTDSLQSPRGRVDFRRIVNSVSAASPSPHCVFYHRSEAVLLNQVLLAGLHLASSVTTDRRLRGHIAQLTQILELSISPVSLTASQLVYARRSIDRRTIAYEPALTLIELLVEGMGPRLGEATESVPLPGFLFDMNRFFQALISRFLRSELTDFSVQDERSLKGVFSFDPSRNPQRRSSRAPRPDFSVFASGRVVALLDAKYRDLWKNNLPRDMLYQLAIYALSQTDGCARSIILYPTMTADACDQVVQFKDPVVGTTRAEVVLRPVHLPRLADLVRSNSGLQVVRDRKRLAHDLVLGPEQSRLAREGRVTAS